MNKYKSEGFTLIELLTVISIIALLATMGVTSMTGTKVKAKKVSFQQTVLSVQRAVSICCVSGDTSLLPASGDPVVGDFICRKGTDHSALSTAGSYPDAKSLGTISVTDCGDGGTFGVVMTPGTSVVGGWTSATCDQNNCQFF